MLGSGSSDQNIGLKADMFESNILLLINYVTLGELLNSLRFIYCKMVDNNIFKNIKESFCSRQLFLDSGITVVTRAVIRNPPAEMLAINLKKY